LRTDDKGRFEFKNLHRGDYILVAQDEAFSTAVIPIKLTSFLRSSKTVYLVLHYVPSGIDQCSYARLKTPQ
jgi:hypothetical protein